MKVAEIDSVHELGRLKRRKQSFLACPPINSSGESIPMVSRYAEEVALPEDDLPVFDFRS